MDTYDIVAIGGGTAGLVTAAGAAALGLRSALIEREALGGDCLWTGCVPSKALIASARLARRMRHAADLGLEGASPAHAFQTVMERMRAARDRIAEHDDPERFRRLGVDVVFGEADVMRVDRVAVGDRTLRTKHIVVATGSRPVAPPVPGLEDAGYLTHVTAFDQNRLPRRVAILGGGPIGLEFAQIYRRLGADVTVFEMLPRLLAREDPAASAALAERLAAEGIAVHLGARVERVERGRDGTHRICAVQGEIDVMAEAETIFVAAGRRANGEGFGLEAAGVAMDRGAVAVDATLRSTVPTIWAAGDVAGGLQFTHVADYQAKLVLRNILSPLRAKADYGAVPWVTYTDPEVARVGFTEPEARERFGAAVASYEYPFSDLDRAVTDGETTGFVKIVTGRGSRILGATIVGHGAGDLLPPIVLAMREKIPLPKLSQMVYAYPTMAEGVKRAADLYYRQALTGWKGRAVRALARWFV